MLARVVLRLYLEAEAVQECAESRVVQTSHVFTTRFLLRVQSRVLARTIEACRTSITSKMPTIILLLLLLLLLPTLCVCSVLQPQMPTFATKRQLANHSTEPLLFEIELLRVLG